MNILVPGGTQFVGRHVVHALLAAGHEVSVFNRGVTADELPAQVERLRGDRDAGAGGLVALGQRTWDACVDVSGVTARQVRPSAELLRDRVRRYVFVSAVAVYGDPQARPVLETHARVPPADESVTELDNQTYGRVKVTCENLVQRIFGQRCTLLRPQTVAGPHDPFDRYSYWVRRAMQGGEMVAPGDGSDHVQVIDARDVGRFVATVIENDLRGAFNLAGPRLTWREFLQILGANNPTWVSAEIIRAAGVGESELPLFRPERGPRSGLMDVSNARAVAAGLTLSDPGDTAQTIRAWLPRCKLAPALSPGQEAELIRFTRIVE